MKEENAHGDDLLGNILLWRRESQAGTCRYQKLHAGLQESKHEIQQLKAELVHVNEVEDHISLIENFLQFYLEFYTICI